MGEHAIVWLTTNYKRTIWLNQGNEYELAPGLVTQYFQFDNGTC
jgi:hypothetical protein